MKGRLVFGFLLSILLLASICFAQPFQYIDESGNIYWAESINEIPPKYRYQVLKPTPTLFLTKKQYREMMKRKRLMKAKGTPKPHPTKKPKPTKPPRKPRQMKSTIQPQPLFTPTATSVPTLKVPIFSDTATQ